MADPALRAATRLLGIRTQVKSALDLAPVIRRGLPTSSLVALASEMELTAPAVASALGLAERTIARRIQKEEALTPTESERVVRLARVIAQCTSTLGSSVKARRWLQKPNRALGGEIPLALLDTDIGAAAVLEELGRIEHGVFA